MGAIKLNNEKKEMAEKEKLIALPLNFYTISDTSIFYRYFCSEGYEDKYMAGIVPILTCDNL